MMRIVLSLTVLALAGPVFADATKAEKIVKEELEKLKVDSNRAKLIKSEALERTFSGQSFFAVIFPQFPVGRAVPEPLKPSNLYVVSAEGKPLLINDAEELRKFFRAARFEDKEAAMKDAVRAYLQLVPELHQDGFYKFKLDEDSIKKADGGASGRVVVDEGGKGDITVTLTFKDGKITAVQENVQIQRGIRPKVLGEGR